MVPPEMTNPTPPGQDIAQSPTLPREVVQTLHMAPTMSAKATVVTEQSVALKNVSLSPLKHPEVTLAYTKEADPDLMVLNCPLK